METGNTPIILIGIFFASLVIFGTFFAAFNLVASPRKQAQLRLNKIRKRHKSVTVQATTNGQHSILADKEGSALDQIFKGLLPHPQELRNRLQQAGLNIGIGIYMVINFITAALVFIGLKLVIGLPLILAILMGCFIGIFAPHYVVKSKIKNRLKAFITLFPDAIDLIVRGLKSGLPINESIQSVGREIDDPVGIEFRRMADAMRLGTTMDEAMWDAAKRIDIADFKFFVICLSVQKETGGNLAETLANLSDILRKRQQMKLKIKAMSAEGRASAMIVGLLPFIMFGMLLSINYDYASILFTDPRAIAVSIGGLIWMGIGVLAMSKMISFEI